MSERRREYPRLRLAVRFSSWALSWLEEKDKDGRRLSGFRLVLAAFAVGYLANWPQEWSGPAVAALAALVFGLPVRDLFRAIPAGEALAALRVFFENTMGKAATAVSDRAGGYFSSTTTAFGVGDRPPMGSANVEDGP
ncbi:MAG: hypothetical protein AMXMBFR53_36430 [Gemmatimonadota bacterium]